MARQSHDIGQKKKKTGQKPMPKETLKKERAKRQHPGPLPHDLRD